METWRSLGILALAGMVAGVAACTATEEESSTAGQAVEKAFDRNNVMTDTELLDPEAYSEQQIQRFFEQYPGVRGYMDRTVAQAREQGYVETLTGRRRQIHRGFPAQTRIGTMVAH